MTPFLANVSIGVDNYKWLLYGDDDTFFFVDHVLALTQTLDHNMPYVITDNLWWPEQRGTAVAHKS